jgi:hypothetical protein
MLYGVEINEPYQVNNEFKLRCFLSVGEDEGHPMSWSSRPHRYFATSQEDAAERIASTLAESWDARVVPLPEEEGPVVFDDEVMPAVVKAFEDRARTRAREARHVR